MSATKVRTKKVIEMSETDLRYLVAQVDKTREENKDKASVFLKTGEISMDDSLAFIVTLDEKEDTKPLDFTGGDDG